MTSGESILNPMTDRSGTLRRWFEAYLEAFAACGRGDEPLGAVSDYYGVPLLLSTDAGYSALTSEGDVLAAIHQQIEGLRAAAYHRSETLESVLRVVNGNLAVYEGTFSRRRADGSEIGRPRIMYLISESSAGPRISAIAIHDA